MDSEMDSSSYIDSGIKYTIDTSDSTGSNYKNSIPHLSSPKLSENPIRYPLNSVEWCIWTSNNNCTIGELRAWVPNN